MVTVEDITKTFGDTVAGVGRLFLGSLVEQLCSAQARIKQLEATLMAWHRSNQASRRLATIPGVGVITATALVATIGDGAQFRSGRQLSAWLGLVPRQHSSWCAKRAALATRQNTDGRQGLLEWGSSHIDPWNSAAGTWLPTKVDGSENLSQAFPGFWELVSDTHWRYPLLRIVDLYLNSKKRWGCPGRC